MKAKKSNVTLQILYQEPLFLLLPKTHPLLSKEAIYIEDLHQETLLYFGEHLQKNHVALLENYQFQFKETTPFYRRTSIQKAISMGQGISIMTKSQVCNDPLYLEGQIVARPIVDFHNTYVHYLIFNKRHIFSRIETDILQRIQSLYHSLEKHTLS
jgi:DNA-binding transcriptional LysR family regulator